MNVTVTQNPQDQVLTAENVPTSYYPKVLTYQNVFMIQVWII